MDTATVPGKYIETLLSTLVQRGFSPAQVLQQCRLPVDEQGQAKVPERVGTEVYTQVYKAYLTLMHGEHFAFSSEQGHASGKYHMLCLALAQCPHLGSALERSRDFYRAFGIAAGSFELAHLGRDTELQLAGKLPIAAHRAAPVAANLLISIKRTLDHLVGTKIPLQAVSLRGTAGAHPERYSALFCAPVTFAAEKDAIRFGADVLSYPIVHTSQSMQEMFEQLPGILFQDIDAGQQRLQQRIVSLLGHDLSRSLPTQKDMAQRLGISVHRLKQQLSLENSSYRQLKRELRRKLACELLCETDLSVGEISNRLGFPASTALHRAFRNWTGMTPLQYRQTHTG
jgi:AraC-like DNA-binding protein